MNRRLISQRAPLGALALALAASVMLSVAPPVVADQARPSRVAGLIVASPRNTDSISVAELDRIQRAGANTAGVTVFWETADDQNSVHPTPTSMSDGALVVTIRRAHQLGMTTVLEPMFLCPSCSQSWRGAVEPSDTAAFFDSYREMIDHFAELAESEGVSALFVGSEMTSLQGSTSEWREVIRQARQRFTGKIVYETNFDSASAVKFWDAVDLVGVSAYYPLSNEAAPTVKEIERGWRSSPAGPWAGHDWLAELRSLASGTGKPIMFGEVGYRSVEYGAKEPWQFATSQPSAPEVQASAYQALLDTFENERWWAGVIWWEWVVNDTRAEFSPRAKPAEQVLTRWWQQGWRPDATGVLRPPPTSPSSGSVPGANGLSRAHPGAAASPGKAGQSTSEVGAAGTAGGSSAGSDPFARLPEVKRVSGSGRSGGVAVAAVLLMMAIIMAWLVRRASRRLRVARS